MTSADKDNDPLWNRVSVLAHPKGFPNDLKASAADSTNLFQPKVDVTKTCDELSKYDPDKPDSINCKIEISNTGSKDSPPINVEKVMDTLSDSDTGTATRTLGDLMDSTTWATDLKVNSNTCTGADVAVGSKCTIEITFDVNVEGILTMYAKDPATGKELKTTVRVTST